MIELLKAISSCLQNPKEAPQALINTLLLEPLTKEMIKKRNEYNKNVLYIFAILQGKLAVKVGYYEEGKFNDISEPVFVAEFLLLQLQSIPKMLLNSVVSMIAKRYEATIDGSLEDILENMFNDMKNYIKEQGENNKGELSYILRMPKITSEKPVIIEYLESPEGNQMSQINPKEIIKYFEDKAQEKKN